MGARRWSWAWAGGRRHRFLENSLGLASLPVILVLLLALGLRLLRLNFQPLWWDEGWSLYFASVPTGQMLELTSVDIHPPLYYLLLHLWIGLFGPTPVSVRLLSVLIGVGAIPLAYLAGRRLLGRRGGLLAALLLAISPLHVYYSQEVRMYGLVTLLGLLALYFALDWLVEPQPAASRRRWSWLGYALAAAGALYTQYYAAFLLLGLNAVVIGAWLWRRLHKPDRLDSEGTRSPGDQVSSPLRSWFAAQAVAALLYVPWLWYAGGRLLTYVQNKVVADKDVPLGLLTYVGHHLAAFNIGHAEGMLAGWWWLGLLPAGAAVVMAVMLLVGRKALPQSPNRPSGYPSPQQATGWRPKLSGADISSASPPPTSPLCPRFRAAGTGGNEGGPRERRGLPSLFGAAVLCLVVGAVLLACGYVVNLVFPFNPPRVERLLLIALPAYLLLFVAIVMASWRRRPALGAAAVALYVVVGVLSLGFFYGVPRYPDDDYRPLAARLQALARPEDVIVCVHPWQVGYFRAYLPDDRLRPELVLSPRDVLPQRQHWADDPARMAADLDALLASHGASHGRLWLPAHQAMGRILEGQLERYLVEHAYPALTEWYGHNTLLYLFAAGAPQEGAMQARLGDWLSLEGAGLGTGPLAAGQDVLPVDLAWRVSGAPPADAGEYRVGLRLADAAGRSWAQTDSLPLGGLGSFANWPVDRPLVDRYGLLIPAGTPPGTYQVTVRVYRGRDFAVLPATFEGGSGGEVALGVVEVTRPDRALPVAALSPARRLRADFGPLRLLGVTQSGSSTLRNGETADVELFWQARVAPGEDYLPRLQLIDASGRVQAEVAEKPAAGAYPTAWWQAGELVRDPHALAVPATAPVGRYRLVLSLVRAADGRPVKIRAGRTSLDLGEITVEGREHRFEPLLPQHAQQAVLDTAVELVGYDLERPAVAPGSTLAITIDWRAVQTPDRNYRAFVHLLDASGRIVAQHDGVPGEGELPTLGWLPGEYVADRHEIALPADLPAGEYRLTVGLYDPITQQRLGERVVLDTAVTVGR